MHRILSHFFVKQSIMIHLTWYSICCVGRGAFPRRRRAAAVPPRRTAHGARLLVPYGYLTQRVQKTQAVESPENAYAPQMRCKAQNSVFVRGGYKKTTKGHKTPYRARRARFSGY